MNIFGIDSNNQSFHTVYDNTTTYNICQQHELSFVTVVQSFFCAAVAIAAIKAFIYTAKARSIRLTQAY